MKKLITFLSLSLLFVSSIFSLEVDQSELKSAGNNTTIEFINYTGPHKKIDSLASIKGIGSGLGSQMNGHTQENMSIGNKNKYFVVHAVDPTEKGKLDADIILLGNDAQVDHINNLRHIVASFLMSAYGYSEKDAETIAVFVTVYNAVYRGNFDVFQAKYKSVVTKNLSTSNCGLSVNYQDWPGKSEIVIPLLDPSNSGLSTVDTSVISDTKVVSSMKEDDDKNIESRKNMVDLKERESEEAEEKAQNASKTAAEEQKKLNEEKEKTAAAEKEVSDAKKEAVEARKEADADPENKEKQEAAEEKEAAVEEKQEALEVQKTREDEQKKITEEAKEEARESQAFADRKTTEAQNERKEIAKDQNEVQKREIAEAQMELEYGLILVDQKNLLSRLVKFNTDNGETVKSSPVTSIRNRTVYQISGGYIAIAGENVKNGAVKLVTLDNDLMEIVLESNEVIAECSVLVKDNNDFYCVIQSGSDYYLGKYDETLKLLLKSTDSVLAETPIVVTDSGIVVTGKNGKMIVFGKDDLKPLK